ncbi:bifunctional (p)ppGpp synthetase/guanosine-3',5'-bis(diphosphate) 3'-pyrophosphohydrolase [Pigmentiphaga aceris]|uniref:GTP pyrophosphokinase n=1 Tax=Pigmentiphaga aceris TaxID=1940612 RepID=A0A5C0AU63_9BURK|nr:bifunctional (p)ppGpp synthetase/guanosine-3',5'-bis(diphosphate) 3'-pyrophosphohydrolase [Pigmentiphaga aceris]QEI05949.1 bifunctional (p)ppGpp synthetase/guanosine-3',5'-bis(diphosphate) 3'-pyrophosphohydrolase [Pigmentiphaga aceris]
MSPTATTPIFDDTWFRLACRDLPLRACDRLLAASAWAQSQMGDRTLPSGEPVAEHAAGLVTLLASLQVDLPTRIAALVASALPEDAPPTWREGISERFGEDVARLVTGYRGLLRLGAVTRDASDASAGGGAQTEMLRKMLLAMAADLRIVFMRLASRLQTLRWHALTKIAPLDAVATEALELYAPLASRLGIWQVKWEMEDLAFRFLEPIEYKRIAKLLEEKRVEREAFISDTLARLQDSLAAEGINAEVSGRPKHIYSIWNKMRNKGLAFTDLYDLRAVRIIVEDIRSCYAALGLVHQLWAPVLAEYDDYVSRPKANGYRSLHTVVADDAGRPFEVQIRTREMHEFAEFGVAAHWRYKEAGAHGSKAVADGEYDRRLGWIRQLLAWKSDVHVEGEANEDMDLSSLDDRVYVLTPQARVVELPSGATPVDFAYQVHTDLGHRCRGARVDGQMVSLNSRLATGQTVEIIAAKAGGPSRDWLNPQLGYLASHRSRAKVRQWFNAIEMQQRISQGQTLVEKELQRLGKTAANLENLSGQLGFACPEDLYVAVSKEEFSVRQIENAFAAPVAEPEVTPESVARESRADSVARSGKSGVLVVGVDSLLTQLAKCCRPAPPDDIQGFVTKGRGVSIHRADCPSMAALVERHPERVIDVTWGDTQDAVYPVDIFVQSGDRAGLLRDISDVFARLRINVVGVNTQSKQQVARMLFTAEVSNSQQLHKALLALREVAGVTEVSRR